MYAMYIMCHIIMITIWTENLKNNANEKNSFLNMVIAPDNAIDIHSKKKKL